MGNTQKVAAGLRLLYMGNIVALAATLCTLLAFLIPPLVFVTAFVVLVGATMCLVGLVKLNSEHDAYTYALFATVIGVICNLFSRGDGLLADLLNLAGSVCSLLQVYFVIQGTNSFLLAGGFQEQVEMGRRAWKWQIISLAVSAAVLLLALTVVLAPLALAGAWANIVVGIIGLVFYLSYLKASTAVLS